MEEERFPESIYAPDGVHVDFFSGVRIGVPPGTPLFRYKLSDADTGEVYEYGERKGEDEKYYIFTKRKYFTRWKVELYRGGKWYFEHTFDANGKQVFIDLSPGALGDSAAWLPAAIAFTKKWECETTICMRPEHVALYERAYPGIRFIADSEEKIKIAKQSYAYYRIGVHGYGDADHELIDFRKNNLIRHADMILGVDSGMEPPLIVGEEEPKPNFPNILAATPRYVCIATRASRKCKEWHYPAGWADVVEGLEKRGFKTVCIDADNQNMPGGAIDNTGKIPLPSRVDVIKGCSFFIGLPSGLSWLAWACRKPVVLISGFSDAYVEFETPYRVSPPPGVCHGCWGTCDQRDSKRFDSCYHYKNNECTRSITPEMVLKMCDWIISGKTCPVCGAKTMKYAAVGWNFHEGGAQAEDWKYYCCRNCGCYFLDEMRNWTPEMYAENIYNDDYIKVDREFDGTRSRYRAPEIIAYLNKYGSRSVLDYGGGNGILAELLRADGQREAICYDPYCHVDEGYDENTLYDAITAVEVLEHEIHPDQLWDFISRHLRVNGIFLGTTELCDSHPVKGWFYANPRAGHTLLYTRKGIEIMAGKYGMKHISSANNLHLFQKIKV